MKIRELLLAHPWRLAAFNSVLLLLGIAGNTYFQVFCRPTLWAGILIAISFVTTALLPVLTNVQKLTAPVYFIAGVSFMLFLYCLIFFNFLILLSPLAIFYYGTGFLLLIPPFFIIQLGRKGFLNPVCIIARRYFLGGILVSLAFMMTSIILYNQALNDIEDFKRSNYSELKTTFMTEKILGIGFLYHTEYCLYDGWRPPLHEPMVNIGYWAHGLEDPLQIQLKERLSLYRKFFPDHSPKLECSCAWEYRKLYEQDKLWRSGTSGRN